VRCVTTPGSTIDVLVTEAGVAVNPARPDLVSRLREAGIRVRPIDELRDEAARLAAPAARAPDEGRIVAVVEYRDGTVIDLVRESHRP
jgi:citrate lyase subunit alpha / citrate CoA-transferase